jgi:hypothetical protein
VFVGPAGGSGAFERLVVEGLGFSGLAGGDGTVFEVTLCVCYCYLMVNNLRSVLCSPLTVSICTSRDVVVVRVVTVVRTPGGVRIRGADDGSRTLSG